MTDVAATGAPPHEEESVTTECPDMDALLERLSTLDRGAKVVSQHLRQAERYLDDATNGWPRFRPPTTEGMARCSSQLALAADELRAAAREAHAALGEGHTP